MKHKKVVLPVAALAVVGGCTAVAVNTAPVPRPAAHSTSAAPQTPAASPAVSHSPAPPVAAPATAPGTPDPTLALPSPLSPGDPSNPPAGAASAAILNAPVSHGKCVARADDTTSRGTFPDSNCTPGAVNPAVTQADIATTICAKGWTATVRPPSNYTTALKRQQLATYGYDDTRLADYEEDHFLPLELGGSPTDPANLWPMAAPGFHAKDLVENGAKAAVCSGRMTLHAAQVDMVSNWVALGNSLGVFK